MKMDGIKFDEWIKAMSDKNSLRILFYLREFNPNVTMDTLCSALNISLDEIKEKLSRLEELGIVVQSNSMFSLTVDGRNMINSVYSELGENAPAEP